MTLQPMYDSPDPRTRKIIEWVCDKTGKCFSTNEVSLSGSVSVKKKSRLDNEKSLSEILLGDVPYAD